MRNLSAFIGELVAQGVVEKSNGFFRKNPHQDGYPDLLAMDERGRKEWAKLDREDKLSDKMPFSPFASGGIEVKATCGSVPTPAVCRKRGITKPGLGDTRVTLLTGYDWKAHHRETNHLLGVQWDFLDQKPAIVALFYSSVLEEEDWGKIVQPKSGGGRTTSVSIMSTTGIRKMYEGWLVVKKSGGYVEFFNRKNKSGLIN